MSYLPILYYGAPGLESDIFQSYMRCSGYPVQMVLADTPNLAPVSGQTSSIAVIALPKPPEELVQLASELRAHSNGLFKRIFILSEGRPMTPNDPAIEIIERPFRLSEVIKRIQILNRQT